MGSEARGLTNHPITDKDSVNDGVRILNRTGLFTEECKTWIIHGNDPSKTNDLISFETFWENAANCSIRLSVPASQHGYGMAATDDDAMEDALPHGDAVSKFGTGPRRHPRIATIQKPPRCRGNFKCSDG